MKSKYSRKKLAKLSLLFFFILPIIPMGMALAQKAKTFKNPKREISVIVTDQGYFPDQISVFEGEEVRFFVTSTIDGPDCFVVDKHKIFLAAEKGKLTEAQTIFKVPGKYKFYCPSHKFAGHITVIEKVKLTKSSTQEKNTRDVASENESDSQLWRPQSY